MAGNKTRDGLRIADLVRALENLTGVTIREARNHPLVARMEGYTRPCPIASSTDARRMVVPWVREVTTYQNAKGIYQALRTGDWAYVA